MSVSQDASDSSAANSSAPNSSAASAAALDPCYTVSTPERLASLLGTIAPASIAKEVPFVHADYRAMIEASPFCVLATNGPAGLDVSPRGDPPGFVVVEDDKTLLLPERRGNNRADSLYNLLTDPRVALLFLIPGVGETLRVNGTARISTEPRLLERFPMQGKLPRCVLVISVESVFFQCARAIQRSRLWQPPAPESIVKVPSPGKILEALTNADIDGDKYDRKLPQRLRDTLY
jgi:PPOX class probable FMN-dependent enzyme